MTKVALAGFVGNNDGQQVNVVRGDEFPDDHPVPRNNPEQFADKGDKKAVKELDRQDAIAEIEAGAVTAAAEAKDAINAELDPGGLTTSDVAGKK